MHLVGQPTELVGAAAPARTRKAFRPFLRLGVWRQSDRLTRELAAGAIPSSSPELHERALQLTARPTREHLARSLEAALADAGLPARSRGARAPVPALDFDARTELATLAARARARVPVRAQGVALALLLVTDPSGALYSGGPGALRRAAAAAAESLQDGPLNL